MAVIFRRIIRIFEKIKPSAMVLIRSFLGVHLLKKKPHAATQQPIRNEDKSSATVHKNEGVKKKMPEDIMQKAMVKSMKYLAFRKLRINNPDKSNPIKWAMIVL